jgi:hypothetical protein
MGRASVGEIAVADGGVAYILGVELFENLCPDTFA